MIPEPEFAIEAIRYGTISQFPLSSLVVGSKEGERVDIPAIFWLLRNGARCILFNCGFYRQPRIKRYHGKNLIRPDDAVRLTGIEPEQITDIIISHAHFDHVGAIDLFPKRPCGSWRRSLPTTPARHGRKAMRPAASIAMPFFI